jgi:hypothetical protein
MATATETRNGARTADSALDESLRAADLWTQTALAVFDASLRLQTRAVDSAKQMLDESISMQKANRAFVEDMFGLSRKAQTELGKIAESTWRTTGLFGERR